MEISYHKFPFVEVNWLLSFRLLLFYENKFDSEDRAIEEASHRMQI